jgi:hypothetical protein
MGVGVSGGGMYALVFRFLAAALSLGRTAMKYARVKTQPTPTNIKTSCRMIQSALFWWVMSQMSRDRLAASMVPHTAGTNSTRKMTTTEDEVLRVVVAASSTLLTCPE